MLVGAPSSAWDCASCTRKTVQEWNDPGYERPVRGVRLCRNLDTAGFDVCSDLEERKSLRLCRTLSLKASYSVVWRQSSKKVTPCRFCLSLPSQRGFSSKSRNFNLQERGVDDLCLFSWQHQKLCNSSRIRLERLVQVSFSQTDSYNLPRKNCQRNSVGRSRVYLPQRSTTIMMSTSSNGFNPGMYVLWMISH